MGTRFEELNGKEIFYIDGNLTIYEISDIQKEIINAVGEDMTLEIDLGGVEKCDTAGIQLILSLGRSAKDKNKQLTVFKISDAVVQVAKELAIDLEKSFSIGGV